VFQFVAVFKVKHLGCKTVLLQVLDKQLKLQKSKWCKHCVYIWHMPIVAITLK